MRLKLLSWIVLSCLALNVNAQGPTAPTKTLSLSLDESIRLALMKNLTIRLGRSAPQVARLGLESSYGVYDPVFTGRAGQNYAVSSGIFDPVLGEFISGGDTTWQEEFSAGINGSLPTGARYNMSFGLDRRSGDDVSVGSNNVVFTQAKPFEYRSSVGISLTQPLLKNFWIDTGRLNIKIAKREVKMSEFTLQLTIMDVINQTAQAYYDLIAARDQVKVQEMAVQVKDQFLSETKKKVQTGTLAQLDEKQAESEAATARADLIKARFEAERAENALKGLVSDDFVSLHDSNVMPSEKLLAVSQSINVVESWRTGLEKRPDYLRMKEELEIQNIQLKFAVNQLYPALDVTGTYGRNGFGGSTLDSLDTISENHFPRWGGFITLTVPLSRKSERANHKIQKVNVQTAVLEMKSLEESIIRGIDNAVKAIRSAYAATEATREAVVFAQAALDAEQKKLENGKSTNFQVLELQDDLTRARSEAIAALTAYNKALHEYYFREGTTLERNKIDIEVK